MLVLTREINQRIWIGPDIVVTIIAARNGKARVGIEAPAAVVILREELLDRPDPGPGDGRGGPGR